jgi:hypothetical protein
MLEQCVFQRIFIDRRCGRMAAELVAERRRRRLIWREISTRTSTFAAAPELQAAGPLRGCRTLRAIERFWQTPTLVLEFRLEFCPNLGNTIHSLLGHPNRNQTQVEKRRGNR